MNTFSLDDEERQREIEALLSDAGLDPGETPDTAPAIETDDLAPLANIEGLRDLSLTPMTPGAAAPQERVQPGGDELDPWISEQADSARADLSAAAQQPAQRPGTDIRTWTARALGDGQQGQAAPVSEQQMVPATGEAAAPKPRSRNKLGMWLDAIGSSMGGRSMDTDYWRGLRKDEDERQQNAVRQDLLRAQAERLRKPPITNEAAEQRRREALALAQKREERLAKTAEFRQQIAEDENSPDSELSRAAVERMYALYPQLQGQLDGMSYAVITKDPSVRTKLSDLHSRYVDGLTRGRMRMSDDLQRGRMDYGEGKQIAGEMRAEERDLSKEERTEERREAERGQGFKQDFLKQRGTDLDVAALIQDVENTPGGTAPAGFAERFSNALTARGIDPERMEAWQSKHLILELWSRSQSGAAISGTEEGKFMSQVGLDPAASSEQVEAAYNVLQRIISRRLRAASSANRNAAREIGAEYGLDVDRWIGEAKQEQPKPQPRRSPARSQAASSAADDAGDEPEAARMRTITTPSGKTGERALTDAEAEALVRKGFKVE